MKSVDEIIKYHKRRQARLDGRIDGGPGSGHWGHVGVKGQRGGSAPGGGKAFRMEKDWHPKDVRLKYTSKAKIQQALRDELKAAKKSGDPSAIKKVMKRMEKVDMGRKSSARLMATGRFDPKASQNILNDAKRSAELTRNHRIGTTEVVKNTFPTKAERLAKAAAQTSPAINQKAQNANQTQPKPQPQTQPKPQTQTQPKPQQNQQNQQNQNNQRNQQKTNQPPQNQPQQNQRSTSNSAQSGGKSTPSASLSKMSDSERRTALDAAIKATGSSSETQRLRDIGAQNTIMQQLSEQGITSGAPKVVSESEFKSVPGEVMYRTMNADSHDKLVGKWEQTMYDSRPVYSHRTSSMMGRGVYCTNSKSGSLGYQDRWRYTCLGQMKLASDAKIADESRLNNSMQKEINAGSAIGKMCSDIQRRGDWADAISFYASCRGFDAIAQSSNGGYTDNYHAIINMGKVVVCNSVIESNPNRTQPRQTITIDNRKYKKG